MVERSLIQRYLDDYEQVTGVRKNRFVCPITLRECEEKELIEAHILNAALTRASRKTTVQYGAVDSFYGTRVEASMVHYLNQRLATPKELICGGQRIRVRFEDGTEADAFCPKGRCEKAAKKAGFATFQVPLESGPITVYLRVPKNDPRTQANMTITVELETLVCAASVGNGVFRRGG